jgi:CheY-like chemotaxis protein
MKQILVIEDDVDQRELYKLVLEEAGYQVVEASNGVVGLDLYAQQACDLVITDIFMPEKEGIETILELKRRTPAVKIIAISGGGVRGSYAGKPGAEIALSVAREFGVHATLFKPFSMEQLVSTVNDVIGSATAASNA